MKFVRDSIPLWNIMLEKNMHFNLYYWLWDSRKCHLSLRLLRCRTSSSRLHTLDCAVSSCTYWPWALAVLWVGDVLCMCCWVFVRNCVPLFRIHVSDIVAVSESISPFVTCVGMNSALIEPNDDIHMDNLQPTSNPCKYSIRAAMWHLKY